jgi:hypothetical protein
VTFIVVEPVADADAEPELSVALPEESVTEPAVVVAVAVAELAVSLPDPVVPVDAPVSLVLPPPLHPMTKKRTETSANRAFITSLD